MSTVEVTFYKAKCDECGRVADDGDYGDEYSAWGDPGQAVEMLSEEWATDSKVLCPDCVSCDVCGNKPASSDCEGHIVCFDHQGAFE